MANDLRMYVVRESLVVAGSESVVIHKWDVNLKVGVAVDQKLFQVIL